MRVRCVRLLDARGKPQNESAWLTVGKLYDVLAVLQSDEDWLLRLIGDEPQGLALFRLDQFEIVSPRVPSSWIAVWEEDGFFELSPEAWTKPGFWEDYYNKESGAINIFEEERKKIIISNNGGVA